jgi:hypothetical protein
MGKRRKCYLLIEYARARGSGARENAVLHCKKGAMNAPELCLHRHLSNRLDHKGLLLRRRYIAWKCSGTRSHTRL